MSQNQTVIIDDQDLSQITYYGTWIRGGSPSEYDETVSSSTNVGDYFIVKFRGTAVVVIGTIDITSGGVVTNYSIDSGTIEQATSQAGSGDTYHQQFWRSPVLNMSDHTLRVTMAKVNAEQQAGEGTIWFDYFAVTDPEIKSGSSASAKRKSIGAIAGGVIGGAVVALIIVVLFLFIRKRSAKQKLTHVQPIYWPKEGPGLEASVLPPINTGHPTVAPFIMRQEANEASSPAGNSLFSEIRSHKPRQSETSNTVNTSMMMASTTGSSTSGTTGALPVTPGSRKLRANGGLSSSSVAPGPAGPCSPSQPVQHVDSGVRNVDSETVPAALATELPPVYTPE